jgi:Transposase IS116/IS110/IS902 family
VQRHSCHNESAGKVKSRRTRPGNPYLQGALGTAAMSISHTHGTYLAAKYRRIATRRGPLKTNVAVQPALLVAIWNTAMTNTTYHDPGGDYFTRLHPPQPAKSAKQRRPPTRSHGLPRHPRHGILTEPLTPRTHLTGIFSSGLHRLVQICL